MFKNDFKWNIPAFTQPQWASAKLSHTHFQNHRMTSQPWRKQKNSSWNTLLRIQPAGGACLSWRTKQAGTGFWVIVIRERSVRRCSSQWIGSSGRKQRGREGETQGGRGIKKRCLKSSCYPAKNGCKMVGRLKIASWSFMHAAEILKTLIRTKHKQKEWLITINVLNDMFLIQNWLHF